MYDILQIPDKREHVENRLTDIAEFDDPPDYANYFSSRQRAYAELGLRASEVARNLRKHAGMPIEDHLVNGVWNRDVAMQNVVNELDEQKAAYEKSRAEFHAKAPPLPPPPQ